LTVASGSTQPKSLAAIRLLALLAYPTLILIALWTREPGLRSLSLPLLAMALVGPWPAHRPGQTLFLGSLILALIVLYLPTLALWPPGLICLVVAAGFGLSLRPGQQPLIERFAAVVHATHGREVPRGSLAWLRGWTWLWTGLMTGIGLVALYLAATDRPSLWATWIMIVAPTLIFGTVALEYLLRRRRFPEHEHWTLGRFLMMLARIRPGQLAR
jgi:uncharacterized membrane protein